MTPLPMVRLALHLSCFLLATHVGVAHPEYPRELTKWQESLMPPKSDPEAHAVWFYAANYSNRYWRVFVKDGQPHAELREEDSITRPAGLKFTPEAGRFRQVAAYAAVDDGWLIAFNQGEFGAALYWFSREGKERYQISHDHVVDFFVLANGIHAIEGLAHLGSSEGSVIRISRSDASTRWEAASVVKLPAAPNAISLKRDGTWLIALSNSVLSIGSERKVRTLLADAPWVGFHPNSSILSPNEQRLYIGMRQFVGEFDLAAKKLRFLIPSHSLLNKLSKEDEESVRRPFRRER